MSNVTPREVDSIRRAIHKHGNLTPRELSILLDGVDEGKSIKADQVAPRMAALELALKEHNVRVLFPS
jgi:hypothetical protein